MEIAHAFKKMNNTEKYLEHARKAIDSYCYGKRISSAASLSKECAEYLEESYDYEEAVKFHERTAELYSLEE